MTVKQETKIDYQGEILETIKIHILNVLLSIITLGIYSFWGKVRMRQYVASSTVLIGDHFEYSGTGKELFIGFIKAIALFLVMSIVYTILSTLLAPIAILSILFSLAFYLMLFASFYAITYWALRYRCSRTRWRGIRFRLSGSGFEYAYQSALRWLINIVTLGLKIPSSDVKLYQYKMSHLQYGQIPFDFDAKVSTELNAINFSTLLLFLPTLGLSRFWYKAALQRHLDAHTKLGDLTLRSDHTGGSFFRLYFINGLILLLTFGLGTPFVLQRTMNYYARHLFIVGDINKSVVTTQVATNSDSIAEGLDDFASDDLGII